MDSVIHLLNNWGQEKREIWSTEKGFSESPGLVLFFTPNYQPFCEPRGAFPAIQSSEKLFGLEKGPENAQLRPENL